MPSIKVQWQLLVILIALALNIEVTANEFHRSDNVKRRDSNSKIPITLDEAFARNFKESSKISCNVTGKRSLMEYQDVTQLVDETTLRSLPYNITYEVKSLGNNYIPGSIAMKCTKQHSIFIEHFEIASLVLPQLSVFMTDGSTAVTLEDNSTLHLNLTNRIELHCHMETTSPKVQLCLQVAQNETCTKHGAISSEVFFKPGVEIPVTCRTRFMDITIKSTLSESVNIDSIETFNLKFEEASSKVLVMTENCLENRRTTYRTKISDNKFDEMGYSWFHITLDEAFAKSVKESSRIFCNVTGKSSLMECQDVTQLVDETTLRSVPYNITYEVESLRNNYIPGPIAMKCTKHNFGFLEHFEIASLELSKLSVFISDGSTTVKLEDNSTLHLNLTNRIELSCQMQTTLPTVQLCLQVALNETCRERKYIPSEVFFQPGVEIPVTCRSRFIEMKIKSTLSEPVNIDSLKTFNLKLENASASVSGIVVTTTVSGQIDLTDSVPKTTEKAVLSNVTTAETPSLLIIVFIAAAGFVLAMFLIVLVIYCSIYKRILRQVPPRTAEEVQNTDEGVDESMLEQNNVENVSYYYPLLNIQPRNSNGEASQCDDVENYELEDTSYCYSNSLDLKID